MHLFIQFLEFAELAGTNRIKPKHGFRIQPPIAHSAYGNVALEGSHTLSKGILVSCFFEQSFGFSLPLGYGLFFFFQLLNFFPALKRSVGSPALCWGMSVQLCKKR